MCVHMGIGECVGERADGEEKRGSQEDSVLSAEPNAELDLTTLRS